MGKVLRLIYRAISTHLIHKAGLQLNEGATGAVTLIQRFGSALNIHFHILFLDGVYVYRDNRPPCFQRIKAPGKGELEQLVQLISQRVGRCLKRQGLLEQDSENAWLEHDHTNAGLSPDGSATYFLPRRIGDRRARELMLTNRVLDAQLSVHRYLAGAQYSIADIITWPWAYLLDRLIDENIWDGFPNLKRWVDEVGARPTVDKGYQVARELGKQERTEEEEQARRELLFNQTNEKVRAARIEAARLSQAPAAARNQ